METKPQNRRSTRFASSRRGFTLVELLVVITIIGILAALITAAGVGALKKARQARIKVELDQMAMAIQSTGAFPPNCQVDDVNFSTGDVAATPIDESQVLMDVQRYVRQLATKYAEPNVLVAALVGDTTTASGANGALTGGMSAGEALVFWLSGVSSDPKLPFSGEGGPSYSIPSLGDPNNYQLDPIESRKWVFPFDVSRLQPRLPDGYFDQSKGRFIEYTVRINGVDQFRRINFWQYVPPKATQPYLYFDASRHPAAPAFDPPAATDLSSAPLDVHAIKRRSESTAAEVAVEFCNRDKFQILHAGVDDIWGNFEPMSLAHSNLNEMTFYPDGPFTGDVADTLSNFSEGTLEDAQP